jgi:hypothetical protein
MGKRSRKRPSVAPVVRESSAAPPPPRRPPALTRRARMEDAPKAPWSPFPLVELTIFGGLVLMVLGFVGVAHKRVAFVICGLALVTVASLELSLREHFAGFRSHSTLLAGAAAVIVVVVTRVIVAAPHVVMIAVGLAVFAACFLLLRRAFRRRTGGIGFRA